MSHPFVEYGDEDCRLGADSEFVALSGDRPRQTTSGAAPPPVAKLGQQLGSGRLDSSYAHAGTGGARTAGRVGAYTIRADTGTARPGPGRGTRIAAKSARI